MEYEYDANGNLAEVRVTGQMVWTCVYDAADRLVHVEDGTGAISADYYYDPFGRRLWKEVGGERTYFFYSEEGLIGEYDSTGAETRSYGYKPGSMWTIDPLFLKHGDDYYFYQNDHLGTPQKLVGVNGAVVWAAVYNAFGKADVQIETIETNLRFPGQYEDAETGLHYNWFRYYDPRIGRYVRKDPIGLRGGINLFAYTFNNPMKYRDPKGQGIHPQHIVTPEEAYEIVYQAAIGSFDHLIKMSDREELQDIYNAGYTETRILLIVLGQGVVLPGGLRMPIDAISGAGIHPRPAGGSLILPGLRNRFVFTCKYGWIDMGHFFAAAEWGYWLQSNLGGQLVSAIFPESWLPHGGELAQWLKNFSKDRRHPSRESIYTAEDIPSNALGIQFGRELAKADARLEDMIWMGEETFGPPSQVPGSLSSFAVPVGWRSFLVNSGAVNFERDDEVHCDLRNDAFMYWETDCYILTESILEQLANDGLSETVLDSLRYLLNQKICGEKQFRAAINNIIISPDTLSAYDETLILRYAHQDVTYEIPDDPDYEDTDAVYNDYYRRSWDKVKCESLAYKKYCCCPESISVFDCQDKCLTGECQNKPIKEEYWYPPVG